MTDARLAAGDLAPDFTLPDQDGTPVTLSSLRGQKVVLYFYPAAIGVKMDHFFSEKSLYGKTVTGTIRSTFVIDEEGRIAKPMYNVKATGHVARIRKELGLDG